MCFSGLCKHEFSSGECGKRPTDPCPAMFENEQDYCDAQDETWAQAEDEDGWRIER